jgi:hypothetical protein
MDIKARKLKEEIPGKTALYEIRKSRDIVWEERQQEDGSLDQVTLEYHIEDGDIGYYANEYRAKDVLKTGAKKIDIMAVMVNHAEKSGRWHLYDVKKTLSGEDVALKLCNQWNAGLSYLQKDVLDYLPGYSIKPDLGVVTRCYDKGKMEQHQEEYQKYCDGMEKNSETMSLAQRKKRMDIGKCRARLKAVRAILDENFQAEDGDNTYKIHIRKLHCVNDKLYRMCFPV